MFRGRVKVPIMTESKVSESREVNIRKRSNKDPASPVRDEKRVRSGSGNNSALKPNSGEQVLLGSDTKKLEGNDAGKVELPGKDKKSENKAEKKSARAEINNKQQRDLFRFGTVKLGKRKHPSIQEEIMYELKYGNDRVIPLPNSDDNIRAKPVNLKQSEPQKHTFQMPIAEVPVEEPGNAFEDDLSLCFKSMNINRRLERANTCATLSVHPKVEPQAVSSFNLAEIVNFTRTMWNAERKALAAAEAASRSVIIENLPLSIIDIHHHKIKEYFRGCGKVKRIGEARINSDFEMPSFNAKVMFYSPVAAAKALERDGIVRDGAEIRVRRPPPPERAPPVYAEAPPTYVPDGPQQVVPRAPPGYSKAPELDEDIDVHLVPDSPQQKGTGVFTTMKKG